jgi:hypothetical protein
MFVFLEIYFEAPHSGLKSSFFMRGFKINFQDKTQGGAVGKYATFLYFEALAPIL